MACWRNDLVANQSYCYPYSYHPSSLLLPQWLSFVAVHLPCSSFAFYSALCRPACSPQQPHCWPFGYQKANERESAPWSIAPVRYVVHISPSLTFSKRIHVEPHVPDPKMEGGGGCYELANGKIEIPITCVMFIYRGRAAVLVSRNRIIVSEPRYQRCSWRD